MNYIENLLQGQKVEWKTLREVAELKRGRVISKTYLTENIGDFPVYSSQTMNNGEIGKIDTFDFEGDYLTWTTDGAYAGTIFKRKGKFSITNVCGLIDVNKDVLNLDFLFHWLSITTKKYVYSGMGNPKLMSNQIAKIPIPLPPLAVQQEIANILDTFTTLEAELEAELDCRKRQYHHYRDTLLTFGNEVQWKTLGEVAEVGDGLHGTPIYSEDGKYYFINGNNLKNGSIVFNDNVKLVGENMFSKYGKSFNENTLFLSINGTIGNLAFYNRENILLGKSVAYFNVDAKVLNLKYLYYLLQTNYSLDYFEKYKTGSTIKNLGLKALRNMQIPLPPLEEQRRIVNILDKFDTLTNSITEGLPKEIELRRKQYEYYREKLLSFNKD